MKFTIHYILIFIFVITIFERCANPTAITGGAKDTIPPSLIASIPKAQMLNVGTQTFTYEFDEPINADKLQQELLITPTTENKFTYVIKKNLLTVKFEDEFNDSTTYTFNFREGVGDATERNPVPNFRYAFSTGPFIDSLSIQGRITSLLENKAESDYLVGLYQLSDTLSTTANKPYYFYTTDAVGNFSIENLRADSYLLFAFKDANNNLLYDPTDEPFAIYPDTLEITEQTRQDTLSLTSAEFNAEKLSLVSARPSGNQFQIRYSKPIAISSLEIDDNILSPLLSSDKSEILVYKPLSLDLQESDSIRSIITVTDTLRQVQIDTIYIAFRESKRKPKEISLSATKLQYEEDQLSFTLQSSKPIQSLHNEGIFISIDTLLSFNPTDISLSDDNAYLGKYTVTIPTSLTHIYDSLNSTRTDGLPIPFLQGLELQLATNSIISIEEDTLTQPLSLNITKKDPSSAGTINIIIETASTSFELRLLNKKKEIVRRSRNETTITFGQLPPDTYSIEVFIDDNNNGVWEVANPWTNTPSESYYRYPYPTELKPNWILDIEDINF